MEGNDRSSQTWAKTRRAATPVAKSKPHPREARKPHPKETKVEKFNRIAHEEIVCVPEGRFATSISRREAQY